MSDVIQRAVSEGRVAGEEATAAIEERLRLKNLDEEEREIKAGLNRMVSRLGLTAVGLTREEKDLVWCVLTALGKGFEARREAVRGEAGRKPGGPGKEDETE